MKLKLFSAVLISILYSSCSGEKSLPEVTQIPFKISESDNYGMMNIDGSILFNDEFKQIPSIAVNGVFYVINDEGNIEYFLSEKKPKPINDENYIAGGYYSEGLIPVVRPEQSVSFIRRDGKEAFAIGSFEGKRIEAFNAYFSDGLMLFRTENGKFGYINTTGQVAIKPTFDFAAPFNEGVAIVGKKISVDDKESYKYTFINTSGKDIRKSNQDIPLADVSMFFDGVYSVNNKVFNKDGELAFRSPSKWQWVSPYDNGYAMFNENGNKGLIDKNGEIIIRAKYSSIRRIGNSYIGTNKVDDNRNDIVFLDNDEERIEKIENVDYIDIFDKNRILIKEKDDFYFVDNKGKSIDKTNYSFIASPRYWSFLYSNSLFLSYVAMQQSGTVFQWVNSDYFPAQEAISSILNVLTTKGVGNIQLGSTLKTIKKYYNMGDSDKHRYDYWNNFVGVQGNNNLSSTYRVQFDDYIANYSGYNDHAQVRHIIINIDRSSVTCSNSEKRLYDAVIHYLRNIGFEKIEHNDDWMNEEWDIYKSNNHSYLIAVNEDASKLCLEKK